MYQKDPARQLRSLRSCHLPAEQNPLIPTRDRRAYVPELSERLERDQNLCDGARRCARILAAYTYRRDRESRMSDITVSYIARAMGRCRRTVQRYLRQLERAGYAAEELVAELGSAFVCADLNLHQEPREENAAYIASWLQVLKADSRAIFTAAAHAQRAADYLNQKAASAITAEAA